MKTKSAKKTKKFSKLEKLSRQDLALTTGGIGGPTWTAPTWIKPATTMQCTGGCGGTLNPSTGEWTQTTGTEYPDWD